MLQDINFFFFKLLVSNRGSSAVIFPVYEHYGSKTMPGPVKQGVGTD